MRWRRPTYRITFDILAASQELNPYGSVCVVNRPSKGKKWSVLWNKKLNIAHRHSANGTYSFVGVASKLSSKIHRWGWLSLPEQFRTQPVKI